MSQVRTSVLKVVHERDPKQQILDDMKPLIGKVSPTGGDIIICVYERTATAGEGDSKTEGGIIIPKTASMTSEDKFQGNVGLIVKLGPLADKHTETLGRKLEVGQWVGFRNQDAHAFVLGHRAMRMLEGQFVRLFLDDPDCII